MNGHARQRELGDAVAAALHEQAAAERHQHQQRQVKCGKAETVERPLEFDGNGFPVPQRTLGFATRVGRLRSPS